MEYTINTYYLDSPLRKGRCFDVFAPREITRDTALFIVHGGGWRAGSRTSFHEIMEAFASRGYLTATTDYRLYAKDAFEQISDIRESYDAFVSILKKMHRPLKVAVYGESAGAHLASLMMCAEPGECGEAVALTNEWIKPEKGILQATPVDFFSRDGWPDNFWGVMQSIAGVPYSEAPEIYERLSLKNYIREDNPPIFFVEAELETLFASEETRQVVLRHRELGINSQWKLYPQAEHGFFYELKRQSQKDALEDICFYLEDRLETKI